MIVKKFFTSNYGPLVIGIMLTAIAGWFVNYFIQNQIVNREQKFEIYKHKLNSAESILNETIEIINARLFSLQRIIWTYKNTSIEFEKQNWNAYRNIIEKWNIKDMSYTTKLKIYLGDEIAERFSNNSNELMKKDSIYSNFHLVHTVNPPFIKLVKSRVL